MCFFSMLITRSNSSLSLTSSSHFSMTSRVGPSIVMPMLYASFKSPLHLTHLTRSHFSKHSSIISTFINGSSSLTPSVPTTLATARPNS